MSVSEKFWSCCAVPSAWKLLHFTIAAPFRGSVIASPGLSVRTFPLSQPPTPMYNKARSSSAFAITASVPMPFSLSFAIICSFVASVKTSSVFAIGISPLGKNFLTKSSRAKIHFQGSAVLADGMPALVQAATR